MPHHDKPGILKELLHEVNNQFEIIVGSAELLSGQCSDLSVKSYCEQIQSAAFRASKLLKAHFKEALSSQGATYDVSEAVAPVLLSEPDQGSPARKSPANTLL